LYYISYDFRIKFGKFVKFLYLITASKNNNNEGLDL